MLELELQQYLLYEYLYENLHYKFKDYLNLNNLLCMNEKNDVVSYVPVDATMEDGCLVIGVQEIGL